MKSLLALLFLTLLPVVVQSQSIEGYRWRNRVLLLFTPATDDPLFLQQYQLLQESVEELRDRQVTMILVNPSADSENTGLFVPRSRSEEFYDRFSVQNYQFEMVLLGLDGGEKFRAKNVVTPVSVLIELIDGMPMRKRELRQGYGSESQLNGGGN